MKKTLFFLFGLSFTILGQNTSADYPIKPIDFTKVKITGGFWKSRLDTVSKRTIPYAFQKCEETGRINNFKYAGKLAEGKFSGRFGFDDSDVYKIVEGAAYSLMNEPNPKLDAYLDQIISYFAAAQEPDGYLYTAWTLKANDYNKFACCTYDPKGKFLGTNNSHELYNAGHMYEAAVAHYRATGKKSFLNIATKNADLIYKLCVDQQQGFYPGHQEIEIGLIKLYRVTNNKKYLDLAKLFLERRGRKGDLVGKEYKDAAYSQDHVPVVQQTEAVGHSVRAGYMYSAMTDIAAITGDKAYLTAVDKIWNNIVSKKMYITGGLGSAPGIEGFDADYELPNNAYAETCAAIANVYWNHRMFLLHGNSKYMDVLERSLYNGLMAGLSLEGEKFFYPNPLVFDGKAKFNQGAVCRSAWFDCSCCPSNLARFVPSVSGYAYGVQKNTVFVNLFMESAANLQLETESLNIAQKTNYPWAGNVLLTINNNTKKPVNLKIRIPGWAQNQAVPSDLYSFTNNTNSKTEILVNGKKITFQIENGYATISKLWKKGDKITVNFPMDVKTIKSHPNIVTNKNTLAVQRGPILYCAEGEDNLGQSLSINENSKWEAQYEANILNGVSILKGKDMILVPYVVWGHRSISPMAVWLPEQ